MLRELAGPIHGIRINLKYCSNQSVILYIPGGGEYIVYYTRYPGDGQLVLGVRVSLLKRLSTIDYFLLHSCDEKNSEATRRVNASVTSVTNVSEVLKIC